MKKLRRTLLLAGFMAVNAFAAPAIAAADHEDLNVDNLGGIIVVWCDGCWFWNCNCPHAAET